MHQIQYRRTKGDTYSTDIILKRKSNYCTLGHCLSKTHGLTPSDLNKETKVHIVYTLRLDLKETKKSEHSEKNTKERTFGKSSEKNDTKWNQ